MGRLRPSLSSYKLGNIIIERDWGWAPEYVDAMHRMLQVDQPQDFVVATGRTVGLTYFIENCFAQLDLDWRRYVDTDAALIRPSDMKTSSADPSRAERELGWRANVSVEDVIARLIAHEKCWFFGNLHGKALQRSMLNQQKQQLTHAR